MLKKNINFSLNYDIQQYRSTQYNFSWHQTEISSKINISYSLYDTYRKKQLQIYIEKYQSVLCKYVTRFSNANENQSFLQRFFIITFRYTTLQPRDKNFRALNICNTLSQHRVIENLIKRIISSHTPALLRTSNSNSSSSRRIPRPDKHISTPQLTHALSSSPCIHLGAISLPGRRPPRRPDNELTPRINNS